MSSSRRRSTSAGVLVTAAGPKQPKQPRPYAGHSAPQPARVTGPRHGTPRATVMHVVPRALHSKHTLCPGRSGFRPASSAVSVFTSCRRSIGQPCSSRSTGTWSEAGVEVSNVDRYSGRAYTTDRN